MRSDKHTTQFDELGSKYEQVYGRNQAQIDFINKAIALLPRPAQGHPVRILDVGVGTGKPTSELAAAAGIEVHGFDYSSTMVDIARKNVPSGRFEQAHHLDFSPGSFTDKESEGGVYDGIFAIFSTAALSKSEFRTLVTERFSRWVKKGGYVFIGNFSLKDFPEGSEITERDDESAKVASRFFGITQRFLVWTDEGWKRLLEHAGFEVVEKWVVGFQPDADCSWEPHEFTVARRG